MTARAIRFVKALATDDDVLWRELARELREAAGAAAAAALSSATRSRPAPRISAALFSGRLTGRCLALGRRRRALRPQQAGHGSTGEHHRRHRAGMKTHKRLKASAWL